MVRRPELAPTLALVAPSRIREIADLAFGVPDVYRLHFGESDMPTPRIIREAACRALEEGYTFYTENAGLPGLREAIATKTASLHGVTLDPREEIVVTASGVQALNVAIRCVIDPGDEALILTPNWPNAASIVAMFGGRPREIPFSPGGRTIDFDGLAAAVSARTRLLVYTSPSNPLGWVATADDQRRLLEFCRARRLWLLADEVYERIYFEGSVAPSILRVCGREDAVIVAQSFSKSYCMTGWRLGWLAARGDLARKATQLNEFIVSHAPSMVQRAGEIALRGGDQEVIERTREIEGRLSYAFERLRSESRIQLVMPQGAFYLFPRIEGVSDSFDFAVRLLAEQRVSVAPGVAFGAGGEGAVRLCCAAERSVLEPALDRFCRFVAGL